MRRSSFNFVMVLALPAIATLSAARVQAQETGSLGPLNETKLAEVSIVSTEFRFSPTTVLIAAGRAVTLILDNSGAETEHGFFLPALGFRLEAKAGQIVRKRTVFVKPGEYKFICDLPGHHEAGMNGTLIVGPFRLADELPSISGGVQKYTGGTIPPALLRE
jgi:plastocyanin